jgi:DNA repair exonuclease SbcCD ATPase subunit
MIRRLILENWRSYRHADIALPAGTTFVVASNGIGKTSLVEAARWALFGTAPPSDPVRAGSDTAAVTVELLLPDESVLVATRTLGRKKTRSPSASLTMKRDGEDIDETTWEALCPELYGCGATLLERLTMPPVGFAEPSGLGLREHLGSLFGVDGLREAVDRLADEGKTVEREIAALKKTNAAKATQLQTLQTAMEAARQNAETVAADVTAAEEQLNQVRHRDEQVERTRRYEEQLTQLRRETATTLADALAILSDSEATDDVAGALGSRVRDASEALERISVERELIARRREQISHDIADLDGAGPDCPTCRRPLDEVTRRHAHELWTREIAELEVRAAALEDTDEPAARARLAQFQQLLAAWTSVEERSVALEQAAPVADPDLGGVEIPDTDTALQQYRTASERAALARDAARRAEDAYAEAAQADSNLRELDRLFTRQARLLMAKETTNATLNELLTETIEPLALEIDGRWTNLFPRRGNITTQPDGTITRTVEGHPLSFNAFSTAESTAALIIMRILVASMTTQIDFAWFDEPLEHLDPNVRRHVANLLSRATGSREGTLHQVVVTTYEEELARKLKERFADNVELLDVRQESLAS